MHRPNGGGGDLITLTSYNFCDENRQLLSFLSRVNRYNPKSLVYTLCFGCLLALGLMKSGLEETSE